jgi:hypothetical protein
MTRELVRDPALRALLGNMSSSKVGCLLSRATGRNVDGLVLTKLTVEHSAAVWRIVRVI